jgi:hypothetical protein
MNKKQGTKMDDNDINQIMPASTMLEFAQS